MYMSHQYKKDLGAILHRTGVEFRVWAPFAKNVQLIWPYLPYDLPDKSNVHDMQNEQDGYWYITVNDAEPGQSYRYLIDTGKELLKRNDPRARALTDSDNGASVIVANHFDWGDIDFTPAQPQDQIIYELHIGTFNRPDAATPGTFDSAIEKLDYLKNLGVNTVELMPVTSMAFSNGWGYAPNYLYSVESMYGGRHGLMTFIRECHSRGIGVILDVVYNHFFSDTDLWQFDGWSENGRGGIYFYNDERGDTPWGGRPDYGRPEVRQFILDNVTMWFNEYRLDGLRVDSTIYMRDKEGQDNDPAHDISDAWSLLGDITTLAHKINPRALLIAEDSASNSAITRPVAANGCGFDAQWELGFPHAIRDALGLTQGKAPTLDGLLYESTHTYDDNMFARVVFSDSHDTAANGSVRLNQAVTPHDAGSLFAREKLILANALTLTSPGIPMLLQGSEFLQEGSFNEWQALDWSRAEKYAGIVLAHKHLIDLRKNTYHHTGGLHGKSLNLFHTDNDNHVIAYHRWDTGGIGDDVIIIANINDKRIDNYALHLPLPGTWRCRFNSSWKGYSKDFREVTIETLSTDDAQSVRISLSPYNILIFSQDS